MYRINLFREHRNRRRERRRAAVQTALLSILLGLETLCILALAVSANLLEERIDLIRGEVVRLEEQVRARSETASAVDLASARELLAGRGTRSDWYPRLVRLASALEPGLSLVEITGVPADPAGPARMEIGGLSPRGDDDAIFRLVDRLGQDPVYARDFAAIRLGTIEGAEVTRFRIECEAPAAPAAMADAAMGAGQ